MRTHDAFTFTDLADGDETWVGIRVDDSSVALTLSKKADGDLEVFMPRDVAAKLAASLREASGS